MSVLNYNDLIRTEEQKKKKMTLPEAIKRVSLACPQEGMHSVDIAKEITANELYFKKMDHLLMESKLDHVQIIIVIFLFVYLITLLN